MISMSQMLMLMMEMRNGSIPMINRTVLDNLLFWGIELCSLVRELREVAQIVTLMML